MMSEKNQGKMTPNHFEAIAYHQAGSAIIDLHGDLTARSYHHDL
jgi:hypothetical protein